MEADKGGMGELGGGKNLCVWLESTMFVRMLKVIYLHLHVASLFGGIRNSTSFVHCASPHPLEPDPPEPDLPEHYPPWHDPRATP